MNLNIEYAEKLVENLGDFIKTVEKKNGDWGYDTQALDDLKKDLLSLEFYATEYNRDIKQGIKDKHLINKMKDLSLSIKYSIDADKTDSLYVFFTYFLTLHSNIYALGWETTKL